MCCPEANKLPLVLRQPPPPIRTHNAGSTVVGIINTLLNTVPTLSKTEEEYSTERGADGSKYCSYVSGQTSPCHFRQCKMKMLTPTNIESLPVEVIFDILVRVPAQDIYDATRLVCRKWYKIIHTHDFIHAHLQRSTCGLLHHGQGSKRYQLIFIASGKVEIEISELNYEFKFKILSSCNGLLLEKPYNSPELYITNPATKQHFALPLFSRNKVLTYGHAIAYAATSFEYKVVCTFFHRSDNARSLKLGPQDDCVAILTVGVDKDWTCRVKTQHLSKKTKGLFLKSPLNTEGFVHWAENGIRSEHVLTLNVETEIITQFPVPSSLRRHDGRDGVVYLPMGSNLSLFISCSDFSWEFWEMKPETGEWTMMPSIDLEAQFFADERNFELTPVGWSRPREVLVFSVDEGPCFLSPLCFAYNVSTQEVQEFKLDGGINGALVHRNSLVWMDG